MRGGAMLHFASMHEPRATDDGEAYEWDPIEHHEYGDTMGFVRWDEVVACTWRYAP